jgi:predicted CopG family antitoxin
MYYRLRTICISESNYEVLKQLGHTGESFNDVLTKILENKSSEKSNDKKNFHSDDINVTK